jgi:hypothetical protein
MRFARNEYVFRSRVAKRKRAASPRIEEPQLTGIAKELNQLVKESGIWEMPTDPKKFEITFTERLNQNNVRRGDAFPLPNAQRVFLFPDGLGGGNTSCGHDIIYVVGRSPITTALQALVQDLVRQRDGLVSQLAQQAGAQRTHAEALSYGTPLPSPKACTK